MSHKAKSCRAIPISNTERLVPILEETFVDSWESMAPGWPLSKYDQNLVDGIVALFQIHQQRSGVPIRRVLDCGCGTGNPSIGLALSGFEIVAVDSDPQMIQRLSDNCRDAGAIVTTKCCDWRHLQQILQAEPAFDAVICRGNSLIYAGTWGTADWDPSQALTAIKEAVAHMTSVLRSDGIFYLDMMPMSEFALCKDAPLAASLGVRSTDTHNIIIYWLISHDIAQRRRHVEVRRLFESKITNLPEFLKTCSYSGYLMTHHELQDVMKASGLVAQVELPKSLLHQVYQTLVFTRPAHISQ